LEEAKMVLRDKNGQELKLDYSATPQGAVVFSLEVFHGMHAECGNVLAVSVEDYIRAINKLPASTAYVLQRKTVAAGSDKPHRSNLFTADSSFLVASDEDCAAQLTSAEETLSSLKALPPRPLAEIKMPILPGATDSPSSLSYAKKKMWVCMWKGFLYVYPHFGGPLRLTLNLNYFDYSILSIPSNNYTVFSFHKFGYPSFHFTPVEKTDFVRWKCVLISTLRYLLDPIARFEMDVLIQDMSKVNAVCHQHHRHLHPHLHRPPNHGGSGSDTASLGSQAFSEASHGSQSSKSRSHSHHGNSPKPRHKLLHSNSSSSSSTTFTSASSSTSSTSTFTAVAVGREKDEEEEEFELRLPGRDNKDRDKRKPSLTRSRLLNAAMPIASSISTKTGTAAREILSTDAQKLLAAGSEGELVSAHGLKAVLTEINMLDDLASDDTFLSKAEEFATSLFAQSIDRNIKM
jgi:hypothetical protein